MSKHITEEQKGMQFSMMLQIPMSKSNSGSYRVIKALFTGDKAIATPEVVVIAWSLPSEKQTGASSKKTSQGSAYTGNEKTDNKAVEERFQPGADCRQEPLRNCDGIHETIYRWIWEDSGGGGNRTNIFADKVAGMPNVVLKMQGEIYPRQGGY